MNRLYWQKIGQVFVFLILLEVLFWIGGAITQTCQFYENKQKLTTKNDYVIVCIGESRTLVGGKNSYPSQLQAILNKRAGKNKFQVINQGVAGADADFFEKNLPNYITNYQPDMVIAMLGISDPIKLAVQKHPVFLRFLGKTKLYRLTVQIINKLNTAWSLILEKSSNQMTLGAKRANPVIQKKFNKEQKDAMTKVLMIAEMLETKKNYRAAEIMYKEANELNKQLVIIHPDILNQRIARVVLQQKHYGEFVNNLMSQVAYNYWGVDWIESYCHGEKKMENIRDIIESKIAKDPQQYRAYGYLASCYTEGGRKDLAEKYIQKLQEHNENDYSDSTKINYHEILNTLIDNKIQPVFVQYPLRTLTSLKNVFVSEPHYEQIIFVDNDSIFQQALQNEPYDNYFVDRTYGDSGHSTPKGNKLLAENIADQIWPYLSTSQPYHP